jgi:hypothetical protein
VQDHDRLMAISARTAEKWAPSVYFVIGQATWFACVLSAARGVPWVGVVLALVCLALHLIGSVRPLEELKLLVSVALIGGLWESVLTHYGLLSYPSGVVIPGLAPYWLPALWALFAAQFNTTYRWLKSRIGLAALLGAIAGPVSFRAGAALGALRFANPVPAVVALAVGWAVLLPVVTLLSRRWDGRQKQG